MNYRNLLCVVFASCIPIGCAPRQTVTVAPLDINAELHAPSNAAWRAAQAQKLAAFKGSESATLWQVSQGLNGRISAAWPPPDAPIRFGDYEYFAEDGPGNRYPVFSRRTLGGSPEVVLDLNREFPTGTVDIGLLRIAPDNSRLVFSLDSEGSGAYRLFTRSLPDGKLAGPFGGAVHEAEWGAGGALFFTELDGLQATKLFRLRPGGELESVHIPVSKEGHLALHPSGDGQMIVREILPQGGAVWRIDPTERKIRPNKLTLSGQSWRGAATIDGCTFGADALLFMERAGRRELVWSGKKSSGKAEALPLGAEESSVTGIRCYKGHAVAFGRAGNRGAIWSLAAKESPPRLTRLATPFGLTALSLGAHPSPEVSIVRVQLSSLINPPILYELNLESGAFSARAQMGVTNHRADRYTTAQLTARAPDGVAVPITVAYQLGDPPSGPRPVLLTTYGAYGANASTEFEGTYLPLLERGFVIAVAHIRGGGEGGPAWHHASRGTKKDIGTGDLIAVAEALQRLGWGGSRRIALLGRSAGAIPVAGAAALRPDLFGVVVLDAPFLDPIRALADTTRPLVLRERAEWGDPADPTIRAAMARYAPFELPLPKNYPATLVTVHVNDAAVSPLDGARWIARLESKTVEEHLISVAPGTHAGPVTRSGAADEAALRATFILVKLGVR